MTTTATQATLLVTAEALLNGAHPGRCELIDGRIVEMSPPGWEHGRIVINVTQAITSFVRRHKLGMPCGAETGFLLRRNPDRVRAPDFAFIRPERVPPSGFAGYITGAPDFLVEVNSPHDRAAEVLEKVNDWLAAGATSCWVIDPKTKTVAAHRAGGAVVRYRIGDEIHDESMLPGLTLRVTDLFD